MNEAVSSASTAVSISASAARRLNAILKGEAGAALRISVKGGGCSGFQYAFDVDRSPRRRRFRRDPRRRDRARRPGLARNAQGRRARLRRRPDGPVVPGQEPQRGRLLRLRGELLGLNSPAAWSERPLRAGTAGRRWPAKTGASPRKSTKAHENENAFICFLLFFRIRPFQKVTRDLSNFFLPKAIPARAFLVVIPFIWQYSRRF